MSQELLKTQLYPPVEAGTLLDRKRLAEESEQLHKHKLSVVQASAGFGKTSLMCQWYQILEQSHVKVAWLSIDPLGVSPVDLIAYLGMAIARVLPDIEETVSAMVESRRHQTTDTMTATLVNRLLEIEQPTVIFIDDLHCLSHQGVKLLARFIDIAPRQMHFVVASRAAVDLGLAAMRARGQLFELGMEELRFTVPETETYLANSGWDEVDEGAVTLLEQRTDGWITGIKLANLASRGKPEQRQSLLDYSGSHYDVSGFFAEQVLSTQRQEVKSFLLKTSLLTRFSAALCDHALKTDKSRAILDEIEADGLFLVSLDQERQWYRYHPLFRDFLAKQLSETDFSTGHALLLRAADWFSEQGMRGDAIEILLSAREFDKAASLLESCCQDWAYKGRIGLVTQNIQRIPRDVVDRYPTILLTWAWHLIRHLHFEKGQQIIEQVKAMMAGGQEKLLLSDSEFQALRYQLLHREMTLAAAQDDTPLVEAKCRELLSFPEGALHPYLQGSAYSQLIYAQRDQFQMKELGALAARARGVLDRSGFDFALIAVLSVIGTSLYSLGKVELAKQAVEEGISVANRFGGQRSALVALAGLPLSAFLYESNDVKQAEEILSRQLADATDWGMVDQFIAGYITQIRILHLHGEEEEANALFDEGMALALDRNLARLRMALIAEQLRIMSTARNYSRNNILQMGRNAGLLEPVDGLMPQQKSRAVDESRAKAWIRVAMVNDQLADAAHLAKNWRRFCEARGAQISHVRWTILLALLQHQLGDIRIAQRTLREAIAAAAPLGIVRSFLDEGTVIFGLVESCCQAQTGSTHATDLYALKLLEAFGGKLPEATVDDDVVAYGSLGDREIEVLLQVSLGMRNREVAECLGMTEGSVKWYMQQIFDKLGTRSRLRAVERARKLGLIG